MQSALAKKVARRVMALALFISPPASRDWADAMSAELDYVDGSFKALSWSIGCLGTAMKQLCISIFLPGTVAVETEGTMSKFAKISAVALVVGSALFLFAPTFQQAVRLTASGWHRSDAAWTKRITNLGVRAEKEQDAQTLAFVAMQLNENWDSQTKKDGQRDEFADDAVAHDSQLTWVYYPLLARDYWKGQGDPNDARWLALLRKWDPNNAVVYSLEASYHRPEHALGLDYEADRALLANSPEWLASMAKAFSATNYDSYLSRKADLDRDVSQRDGLDDPSRLLFGIMDYRMPEFVNFHLYAKYFLLKEANDFQAEGDLNHAQQDYEKVAHLGGLLQLDGSTDIENMVGIGLQMSADPPLENLLEKSGNAPAAKLLAFQTDLQHALVTRFRIRNNYAEYETRFETTGAYLLQLSLLGMAISAALVLCCGVYLAAGSMMRFHRHQGTVAFARVGVAGAILLFASTVAMYFGYSSYATAFRGYLNAPNASDAHSLLYRFATLQKLPPTLFDSFQRIYLWYAVILAGGAVVCWIFCRHLLRMLRHSAPHPAA
jgi:hypothetical protein